MNAYTFRHKGKTIKIIATHWQTAMQLVQDQDGVALEPNGYWRERAYSQRVYTWITNTTKDLDVREDKR